ncbi:MAG: hypothetical protein WCT99_03125 [Bacteroidota bacterium]|jgi:hypothetical protein
MKNITIFFSLLVFSALLYAQPPGAYMKPRAMERLENYKKVRMLEALKLDEQTGIKLISRYNKHREGMRAIEEQRAQLIQKLESQVQSNASDAEYQKTFAELADTEKKFGDARAEYYSSLKEILTNKQIAEYLIFEKNFAKDLRDIMKDLQKERMKR